MDRGLAVLGIDYPRSRLGGLKIFHINTAKRARPSRTARYFGANALFINYFNAQQKELVTDVKMSGLLARASPPVTLACKMEIKARPSKRASPPSRAGNPTKADGSLLRISTELIGLGNKKKDHCLM